MGCGSSTPEAAVEAKPDSPASKTPAVVEIVLPEPQKDELKAELTTADEKFHALPAAKAPSPEMPAPEPAPEVIVQQPVDARADSPMPAHPCPPSPSPEKHGDGGPDASPDEASEVRQFCADGGATNCARPLPPAE